MNAPEPKSSVFISDREIIEEIESLLSQDTVAGLRGRIVQDGFYEKTHAEDFVRLRQRFEHVGFEPRTPALRAAFADFKERFITLDEILITDFGYDARREVLAIHPNRKIRKTYLSLRKRLRSAYDDFESAYRRLLKAAVDHAASTGPAKTSLVSKRIIFSNEKGLLSFDGRKCTFPPYKNEHCLCRVMFEHPVGQPVDSSVISLEVFGDDAPENDPRRREAKLRAIKDTVYAVNRRVRIAFNTNDNLLSWKGRTVTRNF